MRTLTKSIIVFFLALSVNSSYGQGIGQWSSISLDKKINKKFSLSLSTQTRFSDNISYLQTYLAETGVGYKFAKGFELSGNYRFSNRKKNIEKEFKNRHRFFADLSYGKKIQFLKFDYRIRYQHQFKDNDGLIEFDVNYLRNKLELSFQNKTKFTPYISGDLFYPIGSKFDQVRPKIGFSYKLNKIHSFDFGTLSNIDIIDPIKPIITVSFDYKIKLK